MDLMEFRQRKLLHAKPLEKKLPVSSHPSARLSLPESEIKSG